MRAPARPLLATSVLLGAVALASIGGGCGAAPVTAEAPKAHASAAPFDPCVGAAPVAKKYAGILSKARCDQELYLTMADVAGSLDVQCSYCHANDKSGDPKKFDFPAMTDKKQISLFMHREFVEGLKQRDGSPMECASCHVDKNGKPAAKFLGEPRDEAYAVEWMNLVMVNKFTHQDGAKLKCKDCHVGNYGTPDFQKTVILRGEQLKLHGVTPFTPAPEAPPSEGVPPPCHPKARPKGKPPLPGRPAQL